MAREEPRGACPRCGSDLVAEVMCSSCRRCGGTWFTIEQAERYFCFEATEARGLGPGPSSPADRDAPAVLACPACTGDLIKIEPADDLVLDQCERCSGLFFDAGESLSLKSKLIAGYGGPELRRAMLRVVMHRQGPYR